MFILYIFIGTYYKKSNKMHIRYILILMIIW